MDKKNSLPTTPNEQALAEQIYTLLSYTRKTNPESLDGALKSIQKNDGDFEPFKTAMMSIVDRWDSWNAEHATKTNTAVDAAPATA